MRKRLALVAVWLLFAAAAVGVAFAAADLVDAPVAGGPTGAVEDLVVQAEPSVAETLLPSPADTAAPSTGTRPGDSDKVPKPRTPRSADATTATAPSRSAETPRASESRRTDRPRSPSPSPSRSASASASDEPRPGSVQVRGINTNGGFVQGRCSSGLVSFTASPAVGWSLDERPAGASAEGEVKFERSSGGAEVKVYARCGAGGPLFSVEEEFDNDGGDDSSGEG